MIDYAIPPGDTIRELLGWYCMSVPSLAHKLGMSRRDAYRLLNGDMRMTPKLASDLESIFDFPASFWMKYDENYVKQLKEGKS